MINLMISTLNKRRGIDCLSRLAHSKCSLLVFSDDLHAHGFELENMVLSMFTYALLCSNPQQANNSVLYGV